MSYPDLALPTTPPIATTVEDTQRTVRPRYAAVYVRSAATANQVGHNPLFWQMEQCLTYCQQHGYTVLEHHRYQDSANGDDYRNRPGLHALCVAAQAHEFEVIVTISHDRLARKPLYVAMLLERFDTLGIRVELVHEPTETQQTFIHLLQQFRLEEERERLKRRSRRTPSPEQLPLLVNEEEAAVMRTLFAYAASGDTLALLTTRLTLGEYPAVHGGVSSNHSRVETPLPDFPSIQKDSRS